jgi:DNA-binding transcriptional LysR family regulator
MRINFKLLGTFLAVAESASFRKAAEQSHLSLPAVSMQIKQLEEQLRVSLFHRTTRRVELTAEGERLMISARKAMAELETGLVHIQQAADVQHGRLAFACVPTVASTRLPQILTIFAKRYPGVALHVRELAGHELLEAVRRREVDFGIGQLTGKEGDFDATPVFQDEYWALLPQWYEDKGRTGISIEELSKLPLLKLCSGSAMREVLDSAMTAQGLPIEANYEFMHVTTLIAMAESGLGIALLPSIALPRQTNLKAVRVTRPVLIRSIDIITLRGHTPSPAAAKLVQLCEQLIPPNGINEAQYSDEANLLIDGFKRPGNRPSGRAHGPTGKYCGPSAVGRGGQPEVRP